MPMSREMMRASVGGILIVASGYGIMKATTPTDEEFYNKLSPQLKKQVDLRRAEGKRELALAEQIKRVQEMEESPLGPQKK